jgi:hypothetical protein
MGPKSDCRNYFIPLTAQARATSGTDPLMALDCKIELFKPKNSWIMINVMVEF